MKHRRETGLLGLLVALVVHGAALGALSTVQPPQPPAQRPRPPVRVTLRPSAPAQGRAAAPAAPLPIAQVAPTPAPPKPEPPKAAPPDPAPPKPAPPNKRLAAKREAPSKPAAAADAPAPTAPAPAPRRFAVNLGATVPSGGVAVPTVGDGEAAAGEARLGDPAAPAGSEAGRRPPETDASVRGTEVSPLHVTELSLPPSLLSQPSDSEMRLAYPETARRDGLEANVDLHLLIDRQGNVVQVRVLSAPAHGFAAAARLLVQRLRFHPGRLGDSPVAVWIPWTYKFRLDS